MASIRLQVLGGRDGKLGGGGQIAEFEAEVRNLGKMPRQDGWIVRDGLRNVIGYCVRYPFTK
jgi:hypothetical protein